MRLFVCAMRVVSRWFVLWRSFLVADGMQRAIRNPNPQYPHKKYTPIKQTTPQVGKAVWAEVSKKMEGAGSKEGVAALSAELKALKVRIHAQADVFFLLCLCVSV